MTFELEEMSLSLQQNQIPKLWQEVSYPSIKDLSSWYQNLQRRVEFITQWLVQGSLPFYWLPGFFYPQGFLTGVL